MPHLLHTAELWILEHGEDAIRCVAAPHPMGIEVRYLVNEQPLISRVLPGWTDAAGVADSWREGLEARGWVPTPLESRGRVH